MTDGKYCRFRHAITKAEVQLAEDYVDGVHMIRFFYADAKDGLFREIAQQTCKDDAEFGAMWEDTIKSFKRRDWEVIQ